MHMQFVSKTHHLIAYTPDSLPFFFFVRVRLCETIPTHSWTYSITQLVASIVVNNEQSIIESPLLTSFWCILQGPVSWPRTLLSCALCVPFSFAASTRHWKDIPLWVVGPFCETINLTGLGNSSWNIIVAETDFTVHPIILSLFLEKFFVVKNHLTDRIFFFPHSCWHHFVLLKTLLPFSTQDPSTQRVWTSIMTCPFQVVWTYVIPRLAELHSHHLCVV